MNLTTRSRLIMQWSTDPGDVGAGGEGRTWYPEDTWEDYYGTPKGIVSKVAEIRDNVGQGTSLAVRCWHRGVEVLYDEVRELVYDAGLDTEYRRYTRRGRRP